MVVQQMRLDALAVRASTCLRAAGVPHLLLKGPTTANWLYSPPRPYSDVDLLVPLSRVQHAVRALTDAGVAEASAGQLGEEASHSLLMRSPEGFELDLHVTLPLMQVPRRRRDADGLWTRFEEHIELFTLDDARVPALDTAGRCLVLALHALGNAPRDGQALEDLRRALRLASHRAWREADELAAALHVQPLLQAGLALAQGRPLPSDLPLDVRLSAAGEPAEVFQLERLLLAPPWELPARVLREVLPTRGFMRHVDPVRTGTTWGLTRAYLQRLTRILLASPAVVRRWRAARRAVVRAEL